VDIAGVEECTGCAGLDRMAIDLQLREIVLSQEFGLAQHGLANGLALVSKATKANIKLLVYRSTLGRRRSNG
jgi:hypothetical protein